MKIKNVLFENFRGGSMELPLSGLDIITGTNGIGKTRVLQAVQLAVSGNVPHPIEDRNIDLIELFTREIGKQVMSVHLRFDEAEFERMYSLTLKDSALSVSQEITFGDAEPKGVKESEKRIKELLGEFPVMIDVHKFIRLSDEQRAQLMMQIGAFDIEQWNEKNLRELLFAHCYEKNLPTATLEAALVKYSAKIKADVRSGLLDLQEYFKKQESELRKEIKTMSATAQGAVQLNVTSGKTSMRPTSTINDELEKAREQYSKIVGEIAHAKASREQFDKLKKESVELETKINAVREFASLDKIALLHKEIGILTALIAAVPKELTDRKIELESLVQEANQLLLDARLKENSAKGNLGAMQEKWNLLSSGQCPTCGQHCGDVVDYVSATIETATLEFNDLANEVLEHEQRIKNYSTEYGELRHKIVSHEAQVKNAEKEANELRNQSFNMQSNLSSISTIENRLKEIREYKHDNAYDLDSLELQLQSLKGKGESLNKEYTERVQYDTKILQAKEAAATMKEAESNLDLVKILREKIRLLRWEIVREALTPIQEKATAIFGAALGFGVNAQFTFKFVDDRGNEVFKFGWEIENELGTMFVDFDSLSTAQQLFTLVSVLSPLIELGNPKFKMLMLDNCEVIHPDLRERFIHLLTVAKDTCWLDNILIASSGEFPKLINYGVNYVDLSMEVAA